jgi:hypothetical protein
MKTTKLISKILLLIIATLSMIQLASAQIIPVVETSGPAGSTSKLTLVSNLPGAGSSLSWQAAMGNIIKLMLGLAGTFTFTALVFGGVTMVTAQGDDSKLKKGKAIIFNSLLALLIISTSYAIVLGIAQLQIFQ